MLVWWNHSLVDSNHPARRARAKAPPLHNITSFMLHLNVGHRGKRTGGGALPTTNNTQHRIDDRRSWYMLLESSSVLKKSVVHGTSQNIAESKRRL